MVTASGWEAPGVALHVVICLGMEGWGGRLAPGRVLPRANGAGRGGASSVDHHLGPGGLWWSAGSI